LTRLKCLENPFKEIAIVQVAYIKNEKEAAYNAKRKAEKTMNELRKAKQEKKYERN